MLEKQQNEPTDIGTIIADPHLKKYKYLWQKEISNFKSCIICLNQFYLHSVIQNRHSVSQWYKLTFTTQKLGCIKPTIIWA